MSSLKVKSRFLFVSCNTEVYFSEKKLQFTRSLTDIEFEEWSECILECELNKRNVECRWYKDTLELYPNDRYKFQVDNKVQRLIIPRLELDDAASYGCVCRQEKTSGQLTVKELPYTFVRPLEENVTVVEKQQLTLECESNKPLKDNLAIWTRDGQVLTHSPADGVLIKTSDKTHSLIIYECKMKDHGHYACTIKQASTTCQVNMKGKFNRRLLDSLNEFFFACRSSCGIRSCAGECHSDRGASIEIKLYTE